MKISISLGLLLVASLVTGSLAGDEELGLLGKTLPYFPYCPCNTDPALNSYKLDGTVTAKGDNTFCFTVAVIDPPACDSYCCTQADLRKLEIDVNPACKVAGQILSATVNGQPAVTMPTIEKSVDASTNSYILKLTNLGLNRSTANGAELCITLGDNKPGACSTLEELCVPPAGQAPGVCNTALFDSKVDCCPITNVPDVTPSKPCETCVTIESSITDPKIGFNAAKCANISADIISDMKSTAAAVNATISTPFELTECTTSVVKVCGAFASSTDGDKMQPYASQLVNVWLTAAMYKLPCSRQNLGYMISSTIGGKVPGEGSCMEATSAMAVDCAIPPPPFPKCACEKQEGSMVFVADRRITVEPGRNENVTLYCFGLDVQPPNLSAPPVCQKAEILNKMEFYANEGLRRKVTAIGLQAATAATMRYIPPSWGPYGEDTLKVSGLNWNTTQASGAKVCLELSNTATLFDFCIGQPPGACWLALFDVTRKCCPVSASFQY